MKLPTCKEVSQLASDAMEERLPLGKRLGLRLHLWFCMACRRYVRQLRFLKKASRRAAETVPPPGRLTLSEKARERIKRKVRGEG
jgi:hypothetical protein